MKLPPESLAWRVVRYRRSGIHRAQRLPRLSWPGASMTEAEARARAKATNESWLADAVRLEARWAARKRILTRHLETPCTRALEEKRT